MKYPAIICYRMCRSILKIQHRDVIGRMRRNNDRCGEPKRRPTQSEPGVERNPFAIKSPFVKIKNSTFRVEFSKSPISKELRVKSELELSALGGQFRFPAHLLVGCFKSAQTADFFHNALGVELVFQPFERSVDRLTFSHNYFGHKNSDLTNAFSNEG
jgi:hypothetical protein